MASYYRRGQYWWVSYAVHGKRVCKGLRNKDGKKVLDEKLARSLTQDIEEQVERGEAPKQVKGISPFSVLAAHRENYKGTVTPRVIEISCGSIEKFLKVANPPSISHITPVLVRKYLDARIENKEIGHVTANHIIKYLKAFLNFAIKNNYISYNPLATINKYKVDVLPPRYLRKEEIAKIIEAAKGRTLYPAILTAIHTGLRLGELRRLKWSDFNFENGTITVFLSKAGKFRTIPIHPALRVLKEKDLPFDFASHQRKFRRIRNLAGMPDVGWHTFRHTFITHLILNGVDLPTVQKIAGHSSIETTMIYTHVCQDHAKESLSKISFV